MVSSPCFIVLYCVAKLLNLFLGHPRTEIFMIKYDLFNSMALGCLRVPRGCLWLQPCFVSSHAQRCFMFLTYPKHDKMSLPNGWGFHCWVGCLHFEYSLFERFTVVLVWREVSHMAQDWKQRSNIQFAVPLTLFVFKTAASSEATLGHRNQEPNWPQYGSNVALVAQSSSQLLNCSTFSLNCGSGCKSFRNSSLEQETSHAISSREAVGCSVCRGTR